MERQTYDPSLVGDASREFADILCMRYPEWSSLLSMIREQPDAPWRMNLLVPSPTGDEARALEFWMNGDEPSIGFGHWHSHLGVCNSMEELLTLADAIRTDLMVEYFDGAWDSSHRWILEPWNDDVLLDFLTDPCGSGRIRVRSWGGTKDGEYGLDGLVRGPNGISEEQD